MTEHTHPSRDYRVAAALLIGGAIGAGLTLWLAPRAAREARDRALRSANQLGHAVSDRYREARGRVADAVEGLTRASHSLRNEACDTVASGAHEVELGAQSVQRFAHDARTHPAL